MAKRGRPKKVVIPFEDQQPEVPLEYAALDQQDIYNYLIIRDVEGRIFKNADSVWRYIQQVFPPSDHGHDWKNARKIFDALLARNYTLNFILDQVMRHSASQERIRKTVESYAYTKTVTNWLRDDLPHNTYPDLTTHLGSDKWRYDQALKDANKPPTMTPCPQCERPCVPNVSGYCSSCEDDMWTDYAKEVSE